MDMKKLLFGLMAMMGVLTLSAQSIYDFTVKDDAGKDVSLAEYKGKVLLIVNTRRDADSRLSTKTLSRFTRSITLRASKFSTSPATSSASRLLARFRRFTRFARPTSTSTSRSSTRLM